MTHECSQNLGADIDIFEKKRLLLPEASFATTPRPSAAIPKIPLRVNQPTNSSHQKEYPELSHLFVFIEISIFFFWVLSFTIPFDRECSLHCHWLKTYLVKIVQQMIDFCSFINTLVVQLIFGSGLDEGRFPLSLTALLFFCLQNSGFPLTRMACSVYTKDCYLAPLSIRPVPPWTPFIIRACKDLKSAWVCAPACSTPSHVCCSDCRQPRPHPRLLDSSGTWASLKRGAINSRSKIGNPCEGRHDSVQGEANLKVKTRDAMISMQW